MANNMFAIDRELLFLSAEWGALMKYPREREGCLKRIDELLDLRLIMTKMKRTTRRATSPVFQHADPNLRGA